MKGTPNKSLQQTAGNGVPYCDGDDTFEDYKESLLWSKVYP